MSGSGKGDRRGYSWPPFEPGHEITLKHGAYSPRRVEPAAEHLVNLVLEDPALTYLQAPAFRAALWAWARAEVQVQLVVEYLAQLVETAGDEMAVVSALDDPKIGAAVALLERTESRAESGRKRLGLDPMSRAALGRSIAQGQVQADLAQVMAKLLEQESSDE